MQIRDQISAEVAKVVVGAEMSVHHLLVAVLVGGHVLLEGVPGTAKTLLVRTFARTLGLPFRRVQFTPDMMPSDLTGNMVLRDGDLEFRPGPVFTNVLLADEVNRTPPKTQSALLEVMEERTVTVEGTTHELAWPFFTAATQNPIEYEGTYPLPEAQLDRFLFRLDIGYPDEEAERRMLWLHHQGLDPTDLDTSGVTQAVTLEQLVACAQAARNVTVSAEVAEYLLQVVRRTRQSPMIQLGASPRAAAALMKAAKASAYLEARDYVTPDDVAALTHPVLRHRLVLRPEAELDGYRTDDVVTSVVQSVPVPR
ncbi:MAG: MoxR family ATPase [Acidimicrobiia bacterium]|nr:MoxR family ATPase [Acidimicrobiia bacterium]